MAVTVEPVTPERFPDLVALFGPSGACAGCWCMWWRLARRDFERGAGAGNREALRLCIEQGLERGLLAYDGGRAVGWCSLAPRASFPVLSRSRHLKPVDGREVWSLPCFFVHRSHRRQGLTGLLIDAAVARAAGLGAPALEAYPWDTGERKPASTVYTGLASTFLRHGFTEVARRARHRPILRRMLA